MRVVSNRKEHCACKTMQKSIKHYECLIKKIHTQMISFTQNQRRCKLINSDNRVVNGGLSMELERGRENQEPKRPLSQGEKYLTF